MLPQALRAINIYNNKINMNDLDMTLIEMKEECITGEVFEAERFFNGAPLDTIEIFRDLSPDTEEQVKEELSEEIWEYIQEELEWNKPADKSNNKYNDIDNVIYEEILT